MRILIILITALALSGCIRDEDLNLSYESYQPRAMDDGISISTPQEEGIDPDKLEQIYQETYTEEDLWSLRSLLVFKNNNLVAEAYLKDKKDITTRHLIWSSTKQVMGILSGIAVDQGIIVSIDDPMSDYLSEVQRDHPDKSGITIGHLITMHSGIDYDNDGVGGETDKVLRQIPDNITDFVLSRPMRSSPGSEFHYNDGDPQLMSAILQRSVGKPVDSWADEVFFSKIGVSNYNWVRYKDGTSLGGFGIETTPRELAKIAMCVADSGRYGNQQIISTQWIAEMTSPLIEVSDFYSHGYYWWVDTTRNIHFTWGHGGQFAFIVPDYQLIVVMTSIPNTQGDYQILADEALPVVDDIISACLRSISD
jgi:CubicO group peptidase (beta-lactamase class C family)